MPYLSAGLWGVFAAVMMRRRPEVFALAFLLTTVTVFHGGWLIFGLVTAIAGALAAAVRLPPRRWGAWLRRALASPATIGLVTLLAAVWLSLLLNRHLLSREELQVVLKNSKGLSAGAAVYAAGLLFGASLSRVRLAIQGLVATAAALALLRILQMAGWDLTGTVNAALGIAILGDLEPFAMQNSYASFLVMVLALGLFTGIALARRRWLLAGVLVPVFHWLLVGTRSRTAIGAYLVVLIAAWVLGRGRVQRGAVLGIAALFGVQMFVHPQPGGAKWIFPATATLDRAAVARQLPRLGERFRGALWGSYLSSPRFAIVQRIRVPSRLVAGENYLNILLRRPDWDRPVTFEVDVDGRVVYRATRAAADFPAGPHFWLRVPVERELLAGRPWITVRLRGYGETDQHVNYVEVVGGSFFAAGLQSGFFNGYSELTEDLSIAQGEQRGTLFVFLNQQWPGGRLHLLPSPARGLDNSIVERLAWARLALADFARHRLVGGGFGSLPLRAARYLDGEPVFVEFANAHSNFLEILAECGIVGVLGLAVATFAPIVLGMARLITRRFTGRIAWLQVAFCVFFLSWSLVSLSQYTLTDTRLFHVWLFYLGLWAAWFHRGGYGLLWRPRRREGAVHGVDQGGANGAGADGVDAGGGVRGVGSPVSA